MHMDELKRFKADLIAVGSDTYSLFEGVEILARNEIEAPRVVISLYWDNRLEETGYSPSVENLSEIEK